MIRSIDLGQFSPEVLSVFSSLDREYQNGIGLNEFISPNLSSRGKKSATEVAAKGQQSADFISEIARIQEETVIEEVLMKTYKYTLHYQKDFSSPLMQEILGPEMALKTEAIMNDKDVRKFLQEAPLKFQATGLSEMANRFKELDKIMSFINLVGNLAKADRLLTLNPKHFARVWPGGAERIQVP